MPKTIFITISRGGTARNILQTETYKRLKESGNRLVILTPAYQDERFIKTFESPNVFFENLIEPNWTTIDKLLVGWHKALVYNKSTKFRDLYGIYDPKDGSKFKYIIKKVFFLPLSKINFLKDFFKWLDSIFIKDKYYVNLFDKYKPDLVFATSVMEDADVFVLKQAKQRKIKTIGMVKSWDNTSKMGFRVKTDKLIVWGDYSKEESLKFQNYKSDNIIKCGVPQFDFYVDENYLMSRQEFCQKTGLDINKKIIVFASEGKMSKDDGDIAKIISDYMAAGKLVSQCNLFLRPHFMYLKDEDKFIGLKHKKNIFIDTAYNRSLIFRDKWDYSKEQIKWFSSIINCADIIITSHSTISLDAAAFDKPTINITFDGYKNLPFQESLARYYTHEYYNQVVKTGSVWLTDSKEELLNAINSYLENPNLLSEGRKRLRDYFCYKIDGNSGKRVAEAVLKHLYS